MCGNDEVHSTLPGEILASAEFYTYDDKYISGTSRTVYPAQLPEETLQQVARTAEKAYRALCCQGLSRVDFFVERGTGEILLNEINTMPGFTNICLLYTSPTVSMPRGAGSRICVIHKNVPGMLAAITDVSNKVGLNIENLTNKSRGDYAYTMLDVTGTVSDQVSGDLLALPESIRVRVL